MSGDHKRIPVLFALTGAAVAVLVAMLFLTRGGTPYGQTDIDQSVPLAVCGMMAGGAIGAAVAGRTESRPKAAGLVVAVAVVLLAGLLGATTGWVVGDIQWSNGVRHEDTALRPVWVGVAIGLVTGLLVLTPRCLRRGS